ncbi:MAG: hypothetical protein JW940_04765 [Polyangiaceae bacterium]|nr:hypothetical protein [Polyangiaceae bacterium]
MRLLARWRWLGLAMGTMACGQGAEPSGYVLIDREARAAGYRVEKDGRTESATLPLALEDAQEATLVNADSRQSLTAQPGEVVIVRGANAETERGMIGRDVEPDMLDLEAPEGVARELAAAVGGELDARGATWRLTALDAWELASQMPVPAEVVGAAPVAIDAVATAELALTDETRASTGQASTGTVAPSLSAQGPGSSASRSTDVAGTWQGQLYSERHGAWYEFTVTMRQSARGLRGEVTAHSWSGTPDDPMVPAKCNGGERWKVREAAQGTVGAEGTITLESQSWAVLKRCCGEAPAPGEYALDHFVGGLSADGNQWNAEVHDHHVMWPGIPIVLKRLSDAGR